MATTATSTASSSASSSIDGQSAHDYQQHRQQQQQAALAQSPPPLSPLSAASSLSRPRNRPGILSRQHSGQHPHHHHHPGRAPSSSHAHDSASPLPSASEDDNDADFVSDSAPMPRRFASCDSSTASRSTSSLQHHHQSHPQQHTGLAGPAGQTPQAIGSGFTASLNKSSPLASAASSIANVSSAGDSPASSSPISPPAAAFDHPWSNALGSDHEGHLSRAKSVSSVSSVTSTSSMEAVPFRAAPLGNIRVSYVGAARAAAAASSSNSAGARFSRPPPSPTMSNDFLSAANFAAAAAQEHCASGSADGNSNGQEESTGANLSTSVSTAGAASTNPLAATPRSMRVRGQVPKSSSDAWHYRNAPGLGSNLGGKPLPGSFRNLQEAAAASAPSPTAVAAGSAQAPEGGASSSSKRAGGGALRHKLAKSASKLGLKPLTVTPSPSPSSPRAGAEWADVAGSTLGGDPLEVQQDLISSTRGLAIGLSDGKGPALRISSATNAPLVVPKLSPLPELNSNSATSPIGHPCSPGGGIFSGPHSPLLTPVAFDALTSSSWTSGLAPNSRPGSRASINRPKGTRRKLSSQDVGSGHAKQASLSPPVTPSGEHMLMSWPPTSPGPHSSPVPTPAELVRMEAQAGMARLPTEGSGPMPGPTPPPPPPFRRTSSSSLVASARNRSPRNSMGSQAKASGLATSPSTPPLHPSNPLTPSPKRPTALRAYTAENVRSKASSRAVIGPELSSSGRQDLAQSPGSPSLSALKNFRFNSPGTSAVRSVGGAASPTPSGPRAFYEGPLGESAEPTAARSAAKRESAQSAQSNQSSSSSAPSSDLPLGAEAPGISITSPSTDATVEPPPMLRMESSATAVSRAVSDTSDMMPPVPFKRPIREIAGKVTAAEQYSDIRGSPVIGADRSEQTPVQPMLQHGAGLGPSRLSAISERSPDGRSGSTSLMSGQGSIDSDVHLSRLPSPAPVPMPSASPAPAIRPSPASRPSTRPRGRDDFEFGDILGEGSYSTVMLAWDLLSNQPASVPPPKPTTTAAAALSGAGSEAADPWVRENKRAYAVKVLDKVHILKERKQKYVSVEKEALSLLIRQPGVITLYWTFQDAESLYFVLELAPNGELLTFIKRYGSFDETTARYYAAQLLETIAGMHAAGVIHRDIKPENVLLDREMRVKVTDFGSAKIRGKDEDRSVSSSTEANGRSSSFVGTAEYVSPELLTEKTVSEASDFWAFGCVLYQMLIGRPPFKATSEYQTFQKIIKRDFEIPQGCPPEAQDLIEKLLAVEPSERLGSNGAEEVKQHTFFREVDWASLWKQDAPDIKTGLQQPAKARSADEEGLSAQFNFDQDFFGHTGWVDAGGDGDGLDGDGDADVDADGSVAQASASDISSPRDDEAMSLQSGNRADDDGDAGEDSDISSSSSRDDDEDNDFSPNPANAPAPRRRGSSALLKMAASITGIDKNATVGRSSGTRGAAANGNRLSGAMKSSSVRERFSIGNFASGSGGTAGDGHVSSSSSISHSQQQQSSQQHQQPGQSSALARRSFQPAPPGAMLNWGALLLPHEAVLYASPAIHRRTGTANLQSKRRMLILTDFPRLLCVKEDATSLKVKSEVLLTVPMASAHKRGSRRVGSGDSLSREGSNATQVSGPITSSSPSPPRNLVPLATSSSRHQGHADAGAAAHMQHSRTDSTSSAGGQTQSPNVMLSVDQRGARSFVVHTSSKSYLYDDPGGDASNWVRSIKSAAQRAGAEG